MEIPRFGYSSLQKLSISRNHKKLYLQFVDAQVKKNLQNLRSESVMISLGFFKAGPGRLSVTSGGAVR